MDRSTRRTTAYAVILIALLGVGVAGLAVWRMVLVGQDLNVARTRLRLAEASVRAENLRGARLQLQIVERRITVANRRLREPELSLLSIVPFARDNLQAVRRTVRLALHMSNGGTDLLDVARTLEDPSGRVNVSLKEGKTPLQTIVALQARMEQLLYELPGPSEIPSSRFLFGPVARAQRDIYQQAVWHRSQLSGLSKAFELLQEMGGARGPRRYLLAVANAAEMRGTGGMILSYGVLASKDGAFALERVGPIDEIKLPQPAQVDGPANYLEHFTPFGPTLFWRSANLGSDLNIVGPVMEAMYKTATGQAVDGVIQIDSEGLAAILRGIGPIYVPGLGVINGDNVVPITLNEAYVQFPDRPVRQEFLGQVAETAFRRLVTGEFPTIAPLAQALAAARDARHVIMHSPRPAAERAITALDADGSVPADPDFAQLTVQNFSNNKLDYYLDTSVKLSGQRRQGELGRFRVEIELANNAPQDGRPPYIFGPAGPDQRVGEYHGLVSLYLPAGAMVAGKQGDYLAAGAPFLSGEGPRTAVRFSMVVPAGERKRVVLDITLPPRPPGQYQLELVPVPRVRPTTYEVHIDGGSGKVEAAVPMTRRWDLAAR